MLPLLRVDHNYPEPRNHSHNPIQRQQSSGSLHSFDPFSFRKGKCVACEHA
jgi:hypothetical protein